MTYNAALAASVVRSVAVVIVGLCFADVLSAWITDSPRGAGRRIRLAVVAVPFLTPNLVVGFGYRGLSLNLLHSPLLNELLYFVLVVSEMTPAAVWLMLYSSPPRVSAEAVHVAKLARPFRESWNGIQNWFALWRRGPASSYFAPAALLFILSFQEAELASLMQVWSWTERLFTDATRGLPAVETLRLVAWPVVIQVLCVAPLVRFLRDLQMFDARDTSGHGRRQLGKFFGPAGTRVVAIFGVTTAILLVVAVPSIHVLRSMGIAGRSIQLQPMWIRELADALLLATTCGGLAWIAASLWGAGDVSPLSGMNRSRESNRLRAAKAGYPPAAHRSRAKTLFGLLLCLSFVPGLMGTLAIGLLTAAAFQRFLPQLAYSPLPLVLAELVWLWPRAVLVHQALESRTRMPAHQLHLLAGSPVERQRRRSAALWWTLRGEAVAGGILLLCWWSYLELMLPTLLAIPGFQPAPMVLYNHLHYGQIAALGVKLVLILGVPAILVACGGFVIIRLRFFRLK